jgi:diamine N-acetyltransferase
MNNETTKILQDKIHFERITARTVLEICQLSETLPPGQRAVVADNAVSIAQGHVSENAWMRAIYAGETPVGFIMLHIGSDWADGIDCPGVFLWRLMIAAPYQGRGVGRSAINLLVRHLRALGIPALYTSYHPGEGSPNSFYQKLGFVPSGEYYGDEPEVVLWLDRADIH